MIRARALAVLTAALLAGAAPPVALAQSGAGDEQYQDPFAGSGSSGSGSSGGSSGSSGASSQGSSSSQAAPSTTQAQPTSPSVMGSQGASAGSTGVGQAPSATTGTTGAGQLPRTGLDLVPLAALGLALVGAGLVLMRRAARDRR